MWMGQAVSNSRWRRVTRKALLAPKGRTSACNMPDLRIAQQRTYGKGLGMTARFEIRQQRAWSGGRRDMVAVGRTMGVRSVTGTVGPVAFSGLILVSTKLKQESVLSHATQKGPAFAERSSPPQVLQNGPAQSILVSCSGARIRHHHRHTFPASACDAPTPASSAPEHLQISVRSTSAGHARVSGGLKESPLPEIPPEVSVEQALITTHEAVFR